MSMIVRLSGAKNGMPMSASYTFEVSTAPSQQVGPFSFDAARVELTRRLGVDRGMAREILIDAWFESEKTVSPKSV